MRTDLTGRVAIVTGAGRGIGRAIALELADLGARVVIADVSDAEGRDVAERCGGRYVRTDVTRSAEVDACVAAAVREYRRLDALVNNAGITEFVDFFAIDDALWDRVNDVDARGAFYFTRAAARQMRDQGSGGSIVNIASIAAKGYRYTSSAAYAAAKGALLGLTRASAMQLAPYRIRVNAICPGITRTTLNAEWLAAHPERIDEIPLRVPNRPEHIAELTAFLVSSAGETVTGQSWNVDGGLVID